jgi:hypothetical protein
MNQSPVRLENFDKVLLPLRFRSTVVNLCSVESAVSVLSFCLDRSLNDDVEELVPVSGLLPTKHHSETLDILH